MVDAADHCNDVLEKQMALFEKRRQGAGQAIPAKPNHLFCLYCADPTEGGAAYCCDECEEDAMKLAKAKRLNGKLR